MCIERRRKEKWPNMRPIAEPMVCGYSLFIDFGKFSSNFENFFSKLKQKWEKTTFVILEIKKGDGSKHLSMEGN